MESASWSADEIEVYRRFIAFVIDDLGIGTEVLLSEEGADHHSVRLGQNNVVGLGFGSKLKNGVWTDVRAVCVMVVHKTRASSRIEQDWNAHTMINNERRKFGRMHEEVLARLRSVDFGHELETDVIQVGRPAVQSRLTKEFSEKVPGGCAIGSTPGEIGTLGAWVSNNHDEVFFLTCWHCVDSDGGAVAAHRQILQPPRTRNEIGHVVVTVDPRQSASPSATDPWVSTVDAALGKMLCRRRVADFLLGIGEISETYRHSDYLQPYEASKSGAATGVTLGDVQHAFVSISLSLPDGSQCMYHNQISIVGTRPFSAPPISQPGDSGSVLIDRKHRVVGMVVGPNVPSVHGTVATSYATPIQEVLQALHNKESSIGSLTMMTY